MSEKMIFFNIGWMRRYQGIAEDDQPTGGGAWVGEHGWDYSMLNFQEFEGRYYGYGETKGAANLVRLGAEKSADHLEGVTVVWVSTSQSLGPVIVGWYQHAILFHECQEPPDGAGRERDGEKIGYRTTARVEDCLLLPVERRTFRVPPGRSGIGQANVWYADSPKNAESRHQVMAYIESGGEAGKPAARTWIFQANPKTYNIDGALQQLTEIAWSITRHKAEIQPGDRIFIWRCGGDAGIVAEGTVLTEPAEMETSEAEKEFILKPEDFEKGELRSRVRIDRVLSQCLARPSLVDEPRLASLSILANYPGTNFPVTSEQAAVIDALIEGSAESGDEVAAINVPAVKGRTWVYAPGQNARLWEEFYREGIMGIGWDEMGDLRQYPDLETTAKKLIEVYSLKAYPMNDSRACYEFAHVMRPGDHVIAKQGLLDVVGYGTVTGEYEYRPGRGEYHHVRTVRWERKGNWRCPKQIFPVKTLTDFTRWAKELAELQELIEVGPPQPPDISASPYTVADALDGVAFDSTRFEKVLEDWKAEHNLILQGPPGVGKTFLARRLAYSLIGYKLPSHVEMVQFHQSYAYEDFVQGYRPSKSGFECRDGVFVRFCKRASLDQDRAPYVFIIDEINRGNLSKIFGELMVLIEGDKRDNRHSLALAYSKDGEQFYVPPNVYVLGMMNTADRSLALVDYALRRRFTFASLAPLFGMPVLEKYLVDRGAAKPMVTEICSRIAALNGQIAADANLGKGFEIGHSYFCPPEGPLTEAQYFRAVEGKIVPLLREYWFDDPEKVRQWSEKLRARFAARAAV